MTRRIVYRISFIASLALFAYIIWDSIDLLPTRNVWSWAVEVRACGALAALSAAYEFHRWGKRAAASLADPKSPSKKIDFWKMNARDH